MAVFLQSHYTLTYYTLASVCIFSTQFSLLSYKEDLFNNQDFNLLAIISIIKSLSNPLTPKI